MLLHGHFGVLDPSADQLSEYPDNALTANEDHTIGDLVDQTYLACPGFKLELPIVHQENLQAIL